MSSRSGMAFALSMVTLLAVLFAGCSDDDNGGGTGPETTLTAEEQFELIDDFLDIDTTRTSELNAIDIDPLELGLGLVHGELIGGVSEDNLSNLDVPGLRKRSPLPIGSASLSFNYVGGWWEIDLDSAITNDEEARSVSLDIRIRFETAAGVPQMAPDENTAKFIEESTLDATVGIVDPTGTTNLNWIITSDVVIDITPAGGATLNSSTEGKFTATFVGQNSSYTFILDVDGQTDNLTVESLEQSCPEAGSISVTMQLTYDSMSFDTPVDHADATWTLSGSIEEGGVVNATIQSGDFSRAVSGDFECGG
ncbi:MAG: hypothetical protein Kow0074_08900 [Candidatus Zixiibacteriota bacterium]